MRRLPLIALSVAPLLWGCAAHREMAHQPTTTPREEAAAVVDPVVVVDEDAGLREPETDPYSVVADEFRESVAVRESRSFYEIGQASFRRGDIGAARELFDLAVDRLSDGGGEPPPELAALADALTASIGEYESRWSEFRSQPTGTDQGMDEAAIDSINVIDLPPVSGGSETGVEVASARINHDVPLVVNNQVRSMLEAYQRPRLKTELLPAFERSGQWLPMIHRIFKEEGIPLDLAWLSLVESGFKATAYSHARARGLWQFIPSTGKLYGLDIDHWTDERGDPLKATRAAARHLRDLHDRYGDWYLVLAAYNAGSGKVDRAIRAVGKKDYWAIAASRHLRRETKNYVPGFLTTLLIAQDPAKYGYEFSAKPEWSFDTVTVDGVADFAVLGECAETSAAELTALNPELRRGMTPGNQATYSLRVPAGSAVRFAERWAAVPSESRLRFESHSVRSGETLHRIASLYSVSADVIVTANDLRPPHRLAVGSILRIPRSGRGQSLAAFEDPEPPAAAVVYYRVRSGDTLSRVAARHGMSVSQLKSLNGMRGDRIVIGARLKVRGASASGGSRAARRESASSVGSGGKSVRHRVQRGESLWTLAARYGVSIAQLRSWNRLADDRITVGQNLIVSNSASTADSSSAGAVRKVRHMVRNGDTLWYLAKRYEVSIAELSRWNSGVGSNLRPGQRLTVYTAR